MALLKKNYQAFEDIVGPENISDDPALLDAYRYPPIHGPNLDPNFEAFTPRGEAVLLPGSTEEVQAIVRVCNKYKIRFKASCSFWSAQGFPSAKNTIQLDMRRMDRILEIDEKNMFAVVEPHVIGATLQAEAMKVGLNAHIHGSGASCSCLASATSFAGSGADSMFLGSHAENMLGIEWVMPNGDILKTGSLGSRLGWFTSDGPGPSVRGLIRGFLGANGSMGVFTKIALKLHPWPGPPTLPVEGTVPAYKAALPDNFRAYTLAFPTWQAWADACYKIWDARIGYIAHRQFNMFGKDLKGAMIRILTDPTRTISDLEELLQDSEVQKMTEDMERDFQIVLAGMTPRDFNWQDNVLDEILAQTGGWKVEAMNDPDIQRWALLYLIRLGHKNLNFVYGGHYEGCFGMSGVPDFGTVHVEEVAALKAEWEKKGAIVAAGGDCTMGGVGSMGGGGSCMWENFTHFDPHEKKSVQGTLEFFEATSKFGMERGLGPGMERANDNARRPDGSETPKEIREKMLARSPQPTVFRYQHKIKEAFNPNNLGDAHYRTLGDPEE